MSNTWQPISTAPKDGTEIIYRDSDGAVSTCAWHPHDFNDERSGFAWYDIHTDQIGFPVHWVPLPAPPHRHGI